MISSIQEAYRGSPHGFLCLSRGYKNNARVGTGATLDNRDDASVATTRYTLPGDLTY